MARPLRFEAITLHSPLLKGSPVFGRLRGNLSACSIVIRATNYSEILMKAYCSLLVMLALAGLSFPSFAQGLPPGSYQRSCTEVRMRGTTLSAVCRREDGRPQQSTLEISHCAGDIGNRNGRLRCNSGYAAPSPGSHPPAYAGPGYPAPGYPASRYPAPRYGEGQDFHQHCEALQHEAYELRERLEHTPYGEDREHLEHRFHEVNYQRQQCPHH
jgi:hypothetical protein